MHTYFWGKDDCIMPKKAVNAAVSPMVPCRALAACTAITGVTIPSRPLRGARERNFTAGSPHGASGQ